MIKYEGQYYCIETLKNIDTIYKNKIYTIKISKTNYYNFIEIYNENNEMACECEINSFFSKEKLPKHFIPLKEYRKLKLQKINAL